MDIVGNFIGLFIFMAVIAVLACIPMWLTAGSIQVHDSITAKRNKETSHGMTSPELLNDLEAINAEYEKALQSYHITDTTMQNKLFEGICAKRNIKYNAAEDKFERGNI